MQYDKVNDSGARQDFDTGSRRDTREGKGRFDLIPPQALRRLAQHYENGAVKYGDRNWELGQPLSRYFDSMSRHSNCYLEGDRSEDHLAAIMWNAAAMIYTEEMISKDALSKDLDDMPNFADEAVEYITYLRTQIAKKNFEATASGDNPSPEDIGAETVAT